MSIRYLGRARVPSGTATADPAVNPSARHSSAAMICPLTALVAVVAAILIMVWFRFTRIKTHIENAATAATARFRHNHGWRTAAALPAGPWVMSMAPFGGKCREKRCHRHQYGTSDSGAKIHRIRAGQTNLRRAYSMSVTKGLSLPGYVERSGQRKITGKLGGGRRRSFD